MADHTYDVTIGGDTYTVHSATELTDAQAYQYAKLQAPPVPFDVKAQNEVMKANMAKQAGAGKQDLLADFATSGPMGTVSEGMQAAHEGNYPRAAHKILTGVGEVLAPAALPAIAAAPLVAAGSIAGGMAGGYGAKVASSALTDDKDIQDLAGDAGGFVGGMAGGAGISAARPAIRLAGRALQSPRSLRQLAGTALEHLAAEPEVSSSGARTLDVGDPTKLGKGIRLAPSSGPASTGPRVAYGGDNLEGPPAPALREDSGARTLDVEGITPGAEPPAVASGGRTAIPGSSTGPAPYRPAAKAAQRAEDLATKADELKKRTTTMETSGQRVTTSETGVSPTGERVTASRTYVPAGGEGEGAAVDLTGGERAALKKAGYTDEVIDRIMARGTATPAPGGVRLTSPRPQPPVTPVEQTIEDAQRGFSGPDQRVTAGSSPTGTERRSGPAGVSVAERAAEMRAEGITPPASKPEGAAMVNKAVQDARAGSVRTSPPRAKTVPSGGSGGPGASDADIIALRTEHGAEEAGTKLAGDPRFAGLSKAERTNAIRDIAGDDAGLLPVSAQRDIDAKLKTMRPDEAEAYLAKAPNAAAYNYIVKRLRALDLLVDSED